jgi:hypothetical protein
MQQFYDFDAPEKKKAQPDGEAASQPADYRLFKIKSDAEDGVKENKNGLWTYKRHQGLSN